MGKNVEREGNELGGLSQSQRSCVSEGGSNPHTHTLNNMLLWFTLLNLGPAQDKYSCEPKLKGDLAFVCGGDALCTCSELLTAFAAQPGFGSLGIIWVSCLHEAATAAMRECASGS